MISDSKRLKVYTRDKFKCQKCGSSENLSLDHITPVSTGGTDSINNLRTYCTGCNMQRGNFNPSLWERIIGFLVTKRELNDLKNTVKGWVSGEGANTRNNLTQLIQKEISAVHSKFDKNFSEERVYQDKVDKAVVEVLSRFKALEEYMKIEYFEGKEYRKKVKQLKQ